MTETADFSVQQAINDIETQNPTIDIIGPVSSFSGNCTPQPNPIPTATGTIAAEDLQKCEITNSFQINPVVES